MATLTTVTASHALHAAFLLTGKVLCGESCARVQFTVDIDRWAAAASAGSACSACDLEHLRRMGTVRVAPGGP